jgi:cytochrome c1
MLAAGTVNNNRATMEAWITNAQSLKPGALMPNLTQFTGRQLLAMTTYLESLH